MSRPRTAPALRFWPRVIPEPNTGCWLWMGGAGRRGYGRFSIGAETTLIAHRVAWELTHGPIPPGLQVLHRCDNPPCCNPDHLFIGTHQDNMADRNRKGRQARGERARAHTPACGDRNGARLHPETRARGERQGLARLTEAEVLTMRARHAEGESARSLARAFKVAKSTALAAINGGTWSHLPRLPRRLRVPR